MSSYTIVYRSYCNSFNLFLKQKPVNYGLFMRIKMFCLKETSLNPPALICWELPNLNVIFHHLHFRTFSLIGDEFHNLSPNIKKFLGVVFLTFKGTVNVITSDPRLSKSCMFEALYKWSNDCPFKNFGL